MVKKDEDVIKESVYSPVVKKCSCKVGRDIYCVEHGDPDKK